MGGEKGGDGGKREGYGERGWRETAVVEGKGREHRKGKARVAWKEREREAVEGERGGSGQRKGGRRRRWARKIEKNERVTAACSSGTCSHRLRITTRRSRARLYDHRKYSAKVDY